jgi:hypothetical protein
MGTRPENSRDTIPFPEKWVMSPIFRIGSPNFQGMGTELLYGQDKYLLAFNRS